MSVRGVPAPVLEALAEIHSPWELTEGGRHLKVVIHGQLAGILPINGKCDRNKRATLNLVSPIKRVARTGLAARRG